MSSLPDVCFIVEGAYPYVAGGVSSWVHDIIRAQSHLQFEVVSLVPDRSPRELKYEFPSNMRALHHVYLQDLEPGPRRMRGAGELYRQLREPLQQLHSGGLSELRSIIRSLSNYGHEIGRRTLLDSEAAFETLVAMYRQTHPTSSFLHYFWTWRALYGGLFAALTAPLPEARVYHTVSTGYAGLLAARAKVETGRPVLLTEHGIYTNERRIEILMADWLHDHGQSGFSIHERPTDLRNLWVETFQSYARLCYEACDSILTLFQGNQRLQLQEGAPPNKLRVVPNGVDVEKFGSLGRSQKETPPTVALIGRVVPIKDIKTFLRAMALLRETVPDLEALIMGPLDEDSDYEAECRSMVAHLGLEETVVFTDRVDIEDYLPQIDAIVLTSVSEAQPLVILEAGAAGIPIVATDVGSCRELVDGRSDERPSLGSGGAITPVAAPRETADALAALLTDPQHHARCSDAIRRRVRKHYDKADIDKIYTQIYEQLAQGDLRTRKGAA